MRITKKGALTVVNVMGPKAIPEDERMFGSSPLIATTVYLDSLNEQMPELLVLIGKFDSKGNARKNGYGSTIPTGWHELTIGKNINRLFLTIWNPSKTIEEYNESD